MTAQRRGACRRPMQRALWIVRGVVGCAVFLLPLGTAQANDSGPPAHPSASSRPDPQGSGPTEKTEETEKKTEKKKDERLHLGRQLAEESRQAAGEDETAKFKQSPSVQLVARLTGLSLQHAYWLSVVLNFAVIAGVLVWAGKKYLPGFFRLRAEQIQRAIEEARAASQDANRRLAEIEARLSHLDGEIAELRATAEQDGAVEEARIRAAAEADARKIVQSTEQEIAAAAWAPRRELAAYAASLAVALAAQRITIDRATDQGLVRDFIGQLSAEAGPRKGGS
jgi:F-type H+-transporting ATPase subunit b